MDDIDMELAPPDDDRVRELSAGRSLPAVKELGAPPVSDGGRGGGGP
jgi:hypothetical protein